MLHCFYIAAPQDVSSTVKRNIAISKLYVSVITAPTILHFHISVNQHTHLRYYICICVLM